MPRIPRQLSASGVYHVMIRGNERKNIFLNDNDKIRFLDTIQRMKSNQEYDIYAYCLMDNHLHLLIREDKDSLQRSMKRIGVSYSHYFNQKYKRVGHLFQDRFRSENVEGDGYLLAAIRYIHHNPIKAGISQNAEEYMWSSYRYYVDYDTESSLINKKLILGMFSTNEAKAINLFKEFSMMKNADVFIDYDNEKVAKDTTIVQPEDIIRIVLNKYNYDLNKLQTSQDRAIRNAIIREIKYKADASARSLSKMLGISKDIIFRA